MKSKSAESTVWLPLPLLAARLLIHAELIAYEMNKSPRLKARHSRRGRDGRPEYRLEGVRVWAELKGLLR